MPTTNFGWPSPATSDAPNGPAQIQSLAVAADATVKTTDLSARDKPVFGNKKSADQNVSHNTFTAIIWPDADTIDTVGGHNPSSNSSRYVVQTGWAGRYRSDVEMVVGGNATGTRDIEFWVNGVAVAHRRSHDLAVAAADMTVSTGGLILVNLVVGDYIEVVVRQTSGVTLTYGPGGHTATWSVEWLSR